MKHRNLLVSFDNSPLVHGGSGSTSGHDSSSSSGRGSSSSDVHTVRGSVVHVCPSVARVRQGSICGTAALVNCFLKNKQYIILVSIRPTDLDIRMLPGPTRGLKDRFLLSSVWNRYSLE